MTLTFMWVSYDAITINTFLSLKHMFLDMIVCSITHFENFDMDIVVKMARLNVFNLNFALKSLNILVPNLNDGGKSSPERVAYN